MRTILMSSVLALALDPGLRAQDAPACPLHEQHQREAHAALDARGDHVMGFDHTRTTHRFLVEPDGGIIQVEANDPGDRESLDQIRRHLSRVAQAFGKGDFAMPREIHERVLPGVEEMQRLQGAIRYRYEETARGARVRIVTSSSDALAAVHTFLGAQIRDHRTGDPVP
jgi:hypothetical protein